MAMGQRHLTGWGFGRFVGAGRASGRERPSDGGYGDGEVSEPKRFPPDGAGCLMLPTSLASATARGQVETAGAGRHWERRRKGRRWREWRRYRRKWRYHM
jgi:hypothetical protein